MERRYCFQAVSLSRKTKIDKDGGADPRWNEVRFVVFCGVVSGPRTSPTGLRFVGTECLLRVPRTHVVERGAQQEVLALLPSIWGLVSTTPIIVKAWCAYKYF